MNISELRDDQLRHAIQCDNCKMNGQADIILCNRGAAMSDSKRALKDELSRRDRERRPLRVNALD